MHICRRLSNASQQAISHSFREKELQALQKLNPVKGSSIKVHLPTSAATTNSTMPMSSHRRLIVLMAGWAESRHNALSKYASIYTDLGIPCVCLANSVTNMWYTSLGNRATQKIIHLLDSSLESPTSLLLHIFSGGGYVLFPRLLDEQNQPNSLLQSKLIPSAIVFDSGPPIFSYKSGFAAARLLYEQGGSNILTLSLACVFGALTNATIGSRKNLEREAALSHPSLLQFPQLYLYSEMDTVCPAEVIRKVMEDQKSQGRNVSSHCWSDTDHVRHFFEHPLEYRQEITKFLQFREQLHKNNQT